MAKMRPEIFQLIGGRSIHQFNAKRNNTPFDDTAYTKMVLGYIEKGTDLDYQEDGYTLLHLAVQELECDFVLGLLNKGLDINREAGKCGTPLHIALGCYNKEKSGPLLSILLANGADTNIDFGGMPLREFAELSGAGEFFKE